MKAPVTHIEEFLDSETSEYIFARLMNIEWIQVPGRPRKEYWAADRAYTYGSGLATQTYQPQPWPNDVWDLRVELSFMDNWINDDIHILQFDGCFMNRYDTATDYLGWHADDSPEIDQTKCIAIVTLGEGRNIQFMPNGGSKADIETVFLKPGSLMLMHPGMQRTHVHRIPKSGHVQKRPRISLTYRGLV